MPALIRSATLLLLGSLLSGASAGAIKVNLTASANLAISNPGTNAQPVQKQTTNVGYLLGEFALSKCLSC